jgi:tetratricopeptide (TPR) repeat protein
MIRLKSLSLRNFMSVSELDLQFDDETMLIVVGPNGAGKSAAFLAVALAFTDYKKGDSYKDYIQKGCEFATIDLHAEIRGYPIHYDMKISGKKYGVPMSKRIEYRDKVYINSECEVLVKLLDIEYLQHAMFLFQGDGSIVGMRPGERAKLLKKLLRIEFDEQVVQLKGDMADTSAKLLDTNSRLAEAQKRRFPPILLQRVLSPELLSSREAQLAQLDQQLSSLADFDPSQALQTDAQLREATLAAASKKAAYAAGLQQLATLNTQLQRSVVSTPKVDVEDPPIDLEKEQSAIARATAVLSSLAADFRLASAEHDTLQEQLHISQTGVCHACGHAIEPSHVEQLLEKLSVATSNKDSIAAELNTQQHAIDALRKHLKQSSATKALIESLHQAEQLQAQLRQQITVAEGVVADRKEALDLWQQRVALLTKESEAYAEVKAHLSLRTQLLAERKQLAAQLEEQAANAAVNADRVRQLEAQQIEKQHHDDYVQQLAAAINKGSAAVDVYKKTISMFETDFPNYIILQTCAKLENAINGFIRQVFPYMSVKLIPVHSGVEFNYTAGSSSEEWISVKMASGAEAAVLSLAWRVAIAKLYGVSCIMLDEVDAAATEENSLIIYQFIATLSTFEQIVVISHRREAMKCISSLVDNVTCYSVQEGSYTEVSDLDF